MKITEYLKILNDISVRLDSLSSHDDELAQEVLSITNGDRNAWNNFLGRMHRATHEEAETIGQYVEELTMLVRFLSFKRHFSSIDESMLIAILDPPMVSIETKKRLLAQGYSKKDALELIQTMRARWADSFNGLYSEAAKYAETLLQRFRK